MVTENPFKVGVVYKFKTYAPEVLGLDVINVECLAIMNAQTAIREGLDILHFHERIKPHLPAGYNNDPFKMQYIKFGSSDKQTTLFALDWINLDEVVEVQTNVITVTIENVSMNDMETIRKALVVQGYTNINMVLGR